VFLVIEYNIVTDMDVLDSNLMINRILYMVITKNDYADRIRSVYSYSVSLYKC